MVDPDFYLNDRSLAEHKQHYLYVWRSLLIHCICCTTEQAEQWIDEHSGIGDLDHSGDWVYHEPPVCSLIPFLIPASLLRRITTLERHELHDRIRTALDGDILYWHYTDDTDWNVYRARLIEILAEYDAELAAPHEVMLPDR